MDEDQAPKTIDEKIEEEWNELMHKGEKLAWLARHYRVNGGFALPPMKSHLDIASRAALRLESLLGEKAALEERERDEKDKRAFWCLMTRLAGTPMSYPPTPDIRDDLRAALEIAERARGEK